MGLQEPPAQLPTQNGVKPPKTRIPAPPWCPRPRANSISLVPGELQGRAPSSQGDAAMLRLTPPSPGCHTHVPFSPGVHSLNFVFL